MWRTEVRLRLWVLALAMTKRRYPQAFPAVNRALLQGVVAAGRLPSLTETARLMWASL